MCIQKPASVEYVSITSQLYLPYEMLKCCVVICDVFCINITAALLWTCHFAAEVELALTSLWGNSPTETRRIHTQRSSGVFSFVTMRFPANPRGLYQ